MSNEINQFYTLGKLLETGVDIKKIKEFVEQFVEIAERKGEKPEEAIMRIKNFSIELNDALMDTCIKLQVDIPIKKVNNVSMDDRRVTVAEASTRFGLSPKTIRNYI